MPNKWDSAREAALLLSIVEILAPKMTASWDQVQKKMEAKGHANVSGEACRQHYQKLRRGFTTSDPTCTPTKPHKTSAATPKSSKAGTPMSTQKRKRGADAEDDDEEPNLFVDKHKAKKLKTDPEKAEPRCIIKLEEVLDDGTINLEQDSLYD